MIESNQNNQLTKKYLKYNGLTHIYVFC